MIQTETRCVVCNANDFIPIWQFDGRVSGCCRECQHIYTVGELSVNYENFGQQVPDKKLMDTRHNLFQIAKHRTALIHDFSRHHAGRLLEIGCGYGHFLQTMAEMGYEVFGFEPSRNEADFARKYFNIKHVHLAEYAGMDSLCFPGVDAKFDIICAFHVLEHVADPRVFIQSVYSDLESGGLFAVAVPNLFTLHHDLHELYFIANGMHRHTFSPHLLIDLLQQSGFTILHFENEPVTSMSPSSMLILATRTDVEKQTSITIPEMPEPACEAMRKFHRDLDELISRIKEKIDTWIIAGERIAVYGAGHHTTALIKLCGLRDDVVDCIIDDDETKWEKYLGRIKIVAMESQQAKACTRIIVSSLAAEETILEYLRRDYPAIHAYGIYRYFAGENCSISTERQ